MYRRNQFDLTSSKLVNLIIRAVKTALLILLMLLSCAFSVHQHLTLLATSHLNYCIPQCVVYRRNQFDLTSSKLVNLIIRAVKTALLILLMLLSCAFSVHQHLTLLATSHLNYWTYAHGHICIRPVQSIGLKFFVEFLLCSTACRFHCLTSTFD